MPVQQKNIQIVLPKMAVYFSIGNLDIFYHNLPRFCGNSQTGGGKKTPEKSGGVAGIKPDGDT
jgi:hypothetical protein